MESNCAQLSVWIAVANILGLYDICVRFCTASDMAAMLPMTDGFSGRNENYCVAE